MVYLVFENLNIYLTYIFFTAVLSSGASFLISSTMGVIVFAGMQIYKNHLAANEWMTILGGALGSVLFCLLLTVSFLVIDE